MNILLVFGTRPEAIKMCPLVLEFKKHKDIICRVCLTGQHKDMVSDVMDIFGVSADYNLNLMQPQQTLGMITTGILKGLEEILDREKCDFVLVHGDTTSSFSAALAAFYHHIPVGHVEAGLRTYNLQSPFPEEFNRQVVDIISDLYFAPTERAKKQLLAEGKAEDRIYVTGNTVIDALKTTVREGYQNDILNWAEGSKLIIVTAHRRENIGENMKHMFSAIRRIAEDNPDVRIIYPIHKNPAVRKIAAQYLKDCEHIRVIEPLDVIDFHNLVAGSYLILTDSGGIQEEAPAMGKPVLVMRDTTERPEGVEAGTLKLVGTNEDRIYAAANELIRKKDVYERMSKAVNPYGDGHASERIVEIIRKYA